MLPVSVLQCLPLWVPRDEGTPDRRAFGKKHKNRMGKDCFVNLGSGVIFDTSWVVGFKYFFFSSLFGEESHFDEYFSIGLKPPPRWDGKGPFCEFGIWGDF